MIPIHSMSKAIELRDSRIVKLYEGGKSVYQILQEVNEYRSDYVNKIGMETVRRVLRDAGKEEVDFA